MARLWLALARTAADTLALTDFAGAMLSIVLLGLNSSRT